MKKRKICFYLISAKYTLTKCIATLTLCTMLLYANEAFSANVVQRNSNSQTPQTTSRVSMSAHLPTTTITTNEEKPETVEDQKIIEEIEEEIIIENKSSKFDDVLTDSSITTSDSSDTELADMISRQRAILDAQSATDAATASMQKNLSSGQNACDAGLRKCMQTKCGNDFSKCSGDTDTLWGNKMDTCRRETECTGEEYRMFASEIKADRDMNALLSAYTAIIDCGNRYNDCIITECGTTFSNCLGKANGDLAIEKCKTIANNCKEQDSGLASRTMGVFGILRQDAEKQVKRDEERLYEIREEMADQCRYIGALFDERSLDCVFTVEFYAGENSTLYASKKAYAGNSFDCTPNWFGIDVTTFKENAYRLTRSQTSATSSLLGAGLGIAVGAVTSGAINRAIDTQKAEKALKDAKKENDEDEEASDSSKQSTEAESSSTDTEKNNNTNSDKKEEDKENNNPDVNEKGNNTNSGEKEGDKENNTETKEKEAKTNNTNSASTANATTQNTTSQTAATSNNSAGTEKKTVKERLSDNKAQRQAKRAERKANK